MTGRSLIVYGCLTLLFGCSGSVSEAAVLVESSENAEEGQIWAVLVAGSSEWINYRHQADLCHAYQILHAHGVPDERIVVMMYDDLANNEKNPMKGIIINRPNGTDVYKGVIKDYVGSQVTPQNFINVLLGNEEAMKNIGSGKVVKSGPNDRLFINMVDHGGFGIFGFPDHFLSATTLNEAIMNMHRNKTFKEMLIYVEACESGSLFNNKLPADINVFATTASNPTQSSFACYYDTYIKVFLGDVFSVNWMEDTERENLSKETILDQFLLVAKETRTSEVSKYGDVDFVNESLSDFMGSKSSAPNSNLYLSSIKSKKSEVNSRDVPRLVLERQLQESNSIQEMEILKRQIVNLHKNRKFVENTVEEILLRVTWDREVVEAFMSEPAVVAIRWDCYEAALEDFHKNCFNLGKNPYAQKYVGAFAKLCDHGYSEMEIQSAILEVCTHPPVFSIN